MQHQKEDDLTNTMAAQTAAATAAGSTSSRKRLADDSSVASIASITSGRSSKRSIRRQDSLNSVESTFSLGIDDLVNNLEGIDVNYISHSNQNSMTGGGMDLQRSHGSIHSLNSISHSHNNNNSHTSISNNSFSNSFSSAGRNNDSAASRLSSGMWSFSDLEPWTCQMCTFENEAIFTACEMCGHCKQTHTGSKANATFAAAAAAPHNKPSVAEESRAALEAENIRILQEERLRQLAQINQPPRGLSASPPPGAAAAAAVEHAASPAAVVPLAAAAAASKPPLPSTTTTPTTPTIATTSNTSPRPPRNPTNAKPNLVAKRCVSPKRNSGPLFGNTHINTVIANASTTIPRAGEEASMGNAAAMLAPPATVHNNNDDDDDGFDDASFPNLNQLQWQQPLNASPRRYSPTSTNFLAGKVDPQDSADTATTFDMSSSSTFGGYYPNNNSNTELPILTKNNKASKHLRASSSSPPSSASSKKKAAAAAGSDNQDGKPVRHQRFIDV